MANKVENQKKWLEELGWSHEAVEEICRNIGKANVQVPWQEAQPFGSELFKELWKLDSRQASPLQAQKLLGLALACVGMPKELEGGQDEVVSLLEKFSPDLAPHDSFWGTFAKTVQTAFPADDFSQTDGNQELKSQVHQFRYLISSQQAQWVREHYRAEGMTDAEALASYFKSRPSMPYSFNESSRLHNKAYIDKLSGRVFYPDGQKSQVNIKILLDFHTEFILDQQGRFLNIIDPEGASQNGLVNGASFNYGDRNRPGNRASHTRYDVKPPAVWDPLFRRKAMANGGKKFKAPQNNRGSMGYISAKSVYVPGKESIQKEVKKELARFKKLLNRPAFFVRCWAWLRQFWKNIFKS